MTQTDAFKRFTARFKLLAKSRPALITTTLGNIFTMRLIGNKTHGDLAEVAIAEFINQYMADYRSVHVGKERFRAKSQEEDITITSLAEKVEFPVSLKAYGHGPLQLSTDKNSKMFPRLEKENGDIVGRDAVRKVLADPAFSDFRSINVFPLIYDEKEKQCNIMVFYYDRAEQEMHRISKALPGSGNRKHPVFIFYGRAGQYICEVRYGDAAANALQRGP